MARRPRIEFAGAVYHDITRGNNRQKVFKDDRDRKAYLENFPITARNLTARSVE